MRADSLSLPLFPTHLYAMHETSRLLDAASALSRLLTTAHVPHAFYGNVYTAMLANAPQADVGR